jgi:bifunctional DNA-binding transcriptional regulator/antitoxin component of YhaV-PrlF toxin-antitoxin module
MSAVVNARGQITVDRTARERLGVRPGMIAVQQVLGSQLIVTFIPAPHKRSAAGILGKPPRAVPADWADIRDSAERAIAEEILP